MHIKTYLFRKYKGKCVRCGWGEKNVYTNSIPLEVEHIDGNYKNNIGVSPRQERILQYPVLNYSNVI